MTHYMLMLLQEYEDELEQQWLDDHACPEYEDDYMGYEDWHEYHTTSTLDMLMDEDYDYNYDDEE